MYCPFCRIDNCKDLYMNALANEFENTEYWIVHHLTVLCYNLQHNIYSENIWLEARELLSKFVYDNLSPKKAKKTNQKSFNSSKRTFSLVKDAKLEYLINIKWNLMIANINLDEPEKYCLDINNWAKSILGDTEHIIKK